jgi:hypothetical protein
MNHREPGQPNLPEHSRRVREHPLASGQRQEKMPRPDWLQRSLHPAGVSPQGGAGKPPQYNKPHIC